MAFFQDRAAERPDTSTQKTLNLRHLSPAYFGMVMATGIVSLAANQIGLSAVAWVLFAIATLAYLALWGLTWATMAQRLMIWMMPMAVPTICKITRF